jgi:hypothetical protein
MFLIRQINFMHLRVANFIILILSVLLCGCTTGQFEEPSIDSVSNLPIPYKIGKFHHCLLSEADIDLLISIKKGVVEPNVSVVEPERVALSPQDMNIWRVAQDSLENYFPPLVVDENTSNRVFVAIFDGTWNDRDDLDSPLTIPARLSYELEKLSKKISTYL